MTPQLQSIKLYQHLKYQNVTDVERRKLALFLLALTSHKFMGLVDEINSNIPIENSIENLLNQLPIDFKLDPQLFSHNIWYLTKSILNDYSKAFGIKFKSGRLEVMISSDGIKTWIKHEINIEIKKLNFRFKVQEFNYEKDLIYKKYESFGFFDSFFFKWNSGDFNFGYSDTDNLYDYFRLYPQDFKVEPELILHGVGGGDINEYDKYVEEQYANALSSYGYAELTTLGVPNHLVGAIQSLVIADSNRFKNIFGGTELKLKNTNSIFFNSETGEFTVNGIVVKFNIGTLQANVLQMIASNFERIKEWDFNEISDSIEHDYETESKNIRNMISGINNRLASFGIPKFFKIENSMVKINDKYLK